MTALRVLAIPAFNDNYLWLIHDGTHAAIVDPGDAAPVLARLSALHLSLAAILLTHHHADHVGGVPQLLQQFQVPVYGPRDESIDGVTVALSEGDTVTVPELGLQLQVLDVPGHTRGHIAYHAPAEGWLFCGDTLFGAGCGRLFEGTPQQMADSLAKLAALPAQTAVYCAHEYTLANLRFACEVEPENQALQQRLASDRAKRDQGQPTIPTQIGIERATNPFLRWCEPAIVARLQAAGKLTGNAGTDAFAALRLWKNTY
jgi:hydroxyacylglutathione hydrolase